MTLSLPPARTPEALASHLLARSAGDTVEARRSALLFLTATVAALDGLQSLQPAPTVVDDLHDIVQKLTRASLTGKVDAKVAADIYELGRAFRALVIPARPRPVELSDPPEITYVEVIDLEDCDALVDAGWYYKTDAGRLVTEAVNLHDTQHDGNFMDCDELVCRLARQAEIDAVENWLPRHRVNADPATEIGAALNATGGEVVGSRQAIDKCEDRCPFCGSTTVYVMEQDYLSGRRDRWAECDECGARSAMVDTVDAAKEYWAKRVPPGLPMLLQAVKQYNQALARFDVAMGTFIAAPDDVDHEPLQQERLLAEDGLSTASRRILEAALALDPEDDTP